MITITERKTGNDTYYEKTVSGDGGVNVTERIHVRAVVVNKNNHGYYLIYDSNMRVYSEAFEYVNEILASKSNNTKVKAHAALKFLFAFEEIVGKQLAEFNISDVTSLKYFLHGYSPDGQTIKLDLITKRANETVNGYLAVYRSFLQYKGIFQHPLFLTNGKISQVIKNELDGRSRIGVERHATNDTIPKKKVEVPAFISVDEMKVILKYVRANYPVEVEIIIRLMYECGLRIGEVLGLTGDDLVMEKASELPNRSSYKPKEAYVPIAYIRNRCSDVKGQNAKSCMKVISPKQYSSDEYNAYNYGYQFVVVDRNLFSLIDEYIEEAHTVAIKKSPERYYARTVADRVRSANKGEEPNYYVFINSLGTPLSISSWNVIMRDIFKACGIHVDRSKRKDNLNHRFRHGFAMFNILYRHCNEAEVADLLRHKNLGSVMRYFNPTISQQIALKTMATEDMYEAIPELRREDR